MGSAAGTGRFTVQVLLNAVFEEEAHDGPGNDTVPPDIDGSFTPLLRGASRGAVLGCTDPAGAPDLYRFTVSADQRVTLALKALSVGSVNLELQDAGSPGDGKLWNGRQRAEDAGTETHTLLTPARPA